MKSKSHSDKGFLTAKDKLSVYITNSKKMYIREVRYWSFTCINVFPSFSTNSFEPLNPNL